MKYETVATVYTWSQIGTQSLLCLLYCGALYIVCKSEKQTFVTKLIIMMIISCVGALLVMYANINLGADPPFVFYVIIIQGIGGEMRDVMFNVSHWIFAYHYFNSAVAMPYIFNQVSVPEEKQKRLQVLYMTLLVLNIALPTIETGVLVTVNWVANKQLVSLV